MSFRHLNKRQNDDVADLLLAGAKAIGAAALLAVLFPHAGEARPIGYALLGTVLAVAMAFVGVRLHKDRDEESAARPGRRKGR